MIAVVFVVVYKDSCKGKKHPVENVIRLIDIFPLVISLVFYTVLSFDENNLHLLSNLAGFIRIVYYLSYFVLLTKSLSV